MTTPEYSPKHFNACELLPRQVYELTGRGGLRLFDTCVLKSLDYLRDFFGQPIYVNSWEKDRLDGRNWCGLRTPSCPIGAKLSKHKYGVAFDLHCKSIARLNELAMLIKNHGQSFGIVRVESYNVTLHKGYIHCEFGTEIVEKPYFFNP